MNRDDPELEKGKKLYEQGDKDQILYWLSFCIKNHRPIPDWLEQAFLKAYHAGRMFEIKSWDDVFGKPLKKGKRLATERRNMKLTRLIFERVCDLQKAGKPIDQELFAAVGKELSVSGSVVRDLYYALMHEIADSGD